MSSGFEKTSRNDNVRLVTDFEAGHSPNTEEDTSWVETERYFAEYEKEQLRRFYARIGPAKARLLGSTQVTGYKTPGFNYRWATKRKRRN